MWTDPSIGSVSTHYVYCAQRPPHRRPYQLEVGVQELVVGTPLQTVYELTNEEALINLCLECSCHFGTKAGVSLHQKSHHPVEYNHDVVTLVSAKNKFWTEGDIYAMADEEIVWRTNHLMCGVLHHWTIDAIKGKRKDRVYQAILTELQPEVTDTAGAGVGPTEVSESSQANYDLVDGLTSLMASISDMIINEDVDGNILSLIRKNDTDGFVNTMLPLMGLDITDMCQVQSV